MKTVRFDVLARALAVRLDRRRAVAAAGLAAAGGGQTALAGTCRMLKAKCKRSSQCCSWLCKGRKNMTCRAHDTGGCQPGEGGCGAEVPCTTSEGLEGHCFTTSGGAGFCAHTGFCMDCRRDADCQAMYGPRSACLTEGACCSGPVLTACVVAGNPPPPMG